MDELGKKLNIVNPEDWYNVSWRMIQSHGGGGLIPYCGGSPLKLLTSVYPEYPSFVLL
jgi:hypothetical protein